MQEVYQGSRPVDFFGAGAGTVILVGPVNAAAGYPLMTGPVDDDKPVNHVLPAWDLLTGAYAAFALMAAERHRGLTGAGQEVRVPLGDIAIATVGNLGQMAEVLIGGQDRPRVGNDLFGEPVNRASKLGEDMGEAEELLLGIEVFEALSPEAKVGCVVQPEGTREAKFPFALCTKPATP